MKTKILLLTLCVVFVLSICACAPQTGQILVPKDKPEGSAGPDVTEGAPVQTTAQPLPTETMPPPTPEPLPTPDAAGSGDVLFDIYTDRAFADIDNDGTDEEILFTAGPAASELMVDGTPYTIDKPGLAQLFAITDVDIGDGVLEIAFTDEYSDDLADTEFPFTWYYWFDGADFVRMGGLMDMKFAGAWRTGFDPTEHMDGHGMVMCLTNTSNFTDIWYIGHYVPNGADRKFKEDLYATAPAFPVGDLQLKSGYACILLKNIDNDYFGTSYDSMWDYASWPHIMGRVADPGGSGIIVLIANGPETLEVVKVYGKLWTKLKTSDGYSGWVKVVNGDMWGYDDVMYIDVFDMFDGIVIAG